MIEVDTAPLIEALGSDDDSQRDRAVGQLAAIGPPVLPALEAALQREPVATRVGVVDVLESMQDPAAVPSLIQAARDRDAQVVAEAIRALAFVGDDRARPAVEAALHSPDRGIRRSAVLACGRLCRSPEAIAVLAASALTGDGDVARQSLANLASGTDEPLAEAARSAARAVVAPVRQRSALAADEQLRAAMLLAAVGDSSSAEWIAQLAPRRDAGPLRARAVLALAGLPDRTAAVSALVAVAAGQGEPTVHAAACTALAGLAQQRVAGTDAALHVHCPAPPAAPPPTAR